MRRITIQIFFTLLLFVGSISLGAKTLVIASSEGPPHTINSDDGINGIDLDIVSSVLNHMGYKVKFEFMGLKRAQREVLLGRVDAMTPIFSTLDIPGFYVSAPIVEYRPMVFSLKDNLFSPEVLLDLQGHSIVTFQGAPGYFDEDFLYLANTQFYQEMADMGIIPELLVKERYDFAVLDFYMFYYFYRLQDKTRDTAIFTEHELLAPVSASIAFHDIELRDRFNQALDRFLQADGYRPILKKYLGEGIRASRPFRPVSQQVPKNESLQGAEQQIEQTQQQEVRVNGQEGGEDDEEAKESCRIIDLASDIELSRTYGSTIDSTCSSVSH